VQTAVDADHALIVAHAVTLDAADNRQLEPMAEAAQKALGAESVNIVADTGYSNGEQAERCELAGMIPHVPAARSINAGGPLDLSVFIWEPVTDRFLCPEGKALRRMSRNRWCHPARYLKGLKMGTSKWANLSHCAWQQSGRVPVQ